MIEVLENDAARRLARIVVARLIHAERDAIDEYDEHGDALEPRRRDQLEAKVTRLGLLFEVLVGDWDITGEENFRMSILVFIFIIVIIVVFIVIIIFILVVFVTFVASLVRI